MSNFPAIKTGDTTFDKIHAFFLDESVVTLTPKQEEIKERWLAIWTLRLNYHSTDQAVNVHMQKFGVERAQTFRDLKNAEKLFGNITNTSIEGKRAIWAEYCHKFLLQSIKAKDLKAQGKALELLGKAWEVDKVDNQMINPEKLTNPQIKMKFPKELVDAVVAHLESGVLDMNKLDFTDAEIVEDEQT